MPMREQLVILLFLPIQYQVLHVLQYEPVLNEKYDQCNLSEIYGRLGGLAIMNYGISTKNCTWYTNDNKSWYLIIVKKSRQGWCFSLVIKQKTRTPQTQAVKTCNNFDQSKCWQHPSAFQQSSFNGTQKIHLIVL